MVNLTKDMTTREVLEALFDEAGLGEAQFYKIEPGDSETRALLKHNFNMDMLKNLPLKKTLKIKTRNGYYINKDLLSVPLLQEGEDNKVFSKTGERNPGTLVDFPRGQNLYSLGNDVYFQNNGYYRPEGLSGREYLPKPKVFKYESPAPKKPPLPVPIPSELLHKRDYYQKYGQGMKPGMVYDRMDDNRYDQLMKLIREAEGGYVDNKNDPGGKTNFGISENTYPNEDIKKLTRERAELLLYRDFYKRFRIYNISDDRLAGIVLSMAINHDLPAIQRLHTIQGIKPGTIIGPATMKALENKTEEEMLEIIEKYKDETKKFFLQKIKEEPKKKEFQNGWMNRVDAYSY